MSVLVGAGFSKNVSDDYFLSWNELLRKLVPIFQTDNILARFRGLKMDYSITAGDSQFSEFFTAEVDNYITSTGYLKVVSEFIRHKGVRESIDSFIEENTPIAVTKDDREYLQYVCGRNRELIELAPDSLSLHRKLVNFPWNNIYTTNYDNLLEFCVDKKSSKKIAEKIEELDVEISRLLARYEELKIKLDNLNDEVSIEEDEVLEPSLLNSSIALKIEDQDPNEKRKERDDLQRELKRIITDIEDLSSTRSQYRRSLEDCYALVSDSSQLSLKKHRNIVKLHGSIESDREYFSFDRDIHKRYVISNEDYESYPGKHEAFTQLMRISLLQDYFMLIGFSGDDPNFLAWVSWVRDVIQRGPNADKVGKIFLIDVAGDGDTPHYKQQFYHNHQIVHIPLSSPQMLELLSTHCGKKLLPKSYRNILAAFLGYLGENAPYNPSQLAAEKLFRDEYDKSFRSLPFYFDKNTKIDLSSLDKNKAIVATNRRYNRVTSIQSASTYTKHLYLQSFDEILALHPDRLDDLLDTAIACLKDIHIPFRSLVSEQPMLASKIEERLNDYETSSQDLQWLQVFNALWAEDFGTLKHLVDRSDNLSSDVKQQMLILGNLFEFKFTEAGACLEGWDAKDYAAIVKAGLQINLDIEPAKKQLQDADVSLVQENLLGIELQIFLAGFGREQRLREMYNQMEFDGLRPISAMIKTLLHDIHPGKARIETRGNNKFISGDGLHLTSVSKERSSLQIFGLLIESGYPLSTGRSNFYGFQEMFPAVVASLAFYPVPVLFFAIQYEDIPYLKRLGQEYAYEQKVDFYHKRILQSLIRAYSSEDTPARIKVNSLFFLGEFIVAVDNRLWDELLTVVWKKAVALVAPLNDTRTPEMHFIAKSLPVDQNLETGKLILADCLSLTGKEAISAIVSCTYYLQLNPYYKESAHSIRESINNDLIANLITLAESNFNYLIVLGNISIFLNKKDKVQLVSLLESMDFTSIEPVLIEVILSLLDKSDVQLRGRLMDSLTNNPAMFRTGLSDTRPGVYGPAPFIKLRVLRGQNAWSGLTGNQVSEIYLKLKEELGRINRFMATHSIGGLVDFRSNLMEMLWFLEDEATVLEGEPDLGDIQSLVNELLLKSMDGVSDIDALLSNDLVNINWVILRLSREIMDYHRVVENEYKIRQVMTRISMKSPIGLESCVFHLVNWFYDQKASDEMKMYLPQGLELLKRYESQDYPEGCEVPLIEEKLIQLAHVFRFWGDSSEVIVDFCERLGSSRFSNVKFKLSRRLKTDGLLD